MKVRQADVTRIRSPLPRSAAGEGSGVEVVRHFSAEASGAQKLAMRWIHQNVAAMPIA
jgi:hypothetical protein